MPTPRQSGFTRRLVPLHGFLHAFIPRVNIPCGGFHVRMASVLVQPPRVHVLAPPCQARVPQGVQVEWRNAAGLQGLGMLLLQAGVLDVTALGISRKKPASRRGLR